MHAPAISTDAPGQLARAALSRYEAAIDDYDRAAAVYELAIAEGGDRPDLTQIEIAITALIMCNAALERKHAAQRLLDAALKYQTQPHHPARRTAYQSALAQMEEQDRCWDYANSKPI